MHVMLVNDDGIFAPGIRALADAFVSAGHRVSVCAPHIERSAASHSISTHTILSADPIDFEGAETAYAATGTPADCARLGLFLIKDVDLVVSGINNGSNLGGACIYSGTVAAATEASMSGTPAFAISQCGYNQHIYDASARLAVRAAEWVLDHPLPRGDIYNINVPALPYEKLLGLRAAVSAPNYLDDPKFIPVETDKGTCWKYTHGEDTPMPENPDYDVTRIAEGWATISRLTWDLRPNTEGPDMTGFRL